MNILIDYHHQDLYHSLKLLFEKRLGWKVFRPIGTEWADRDYWHYHKAQPKPNWEPVKRQFLDHWASDGDNTQEEGVRIRYEARYGEVDNMLVLDEFFKKKIDVVIASVANHEKSFTKLCGDHPNKPKLIRQVGNVNEIINYDVCKNLLVSSGQLLNPPPSDVNVVYYHQEFDLDIFNYQPPKESKIIKSFLQCPLNIPSFIALWDIYRHLLPDFTWKMHGAYSRDGVIDGLKNLADCMREATFIWHTKRGGDGFGHIIHNAFALGRPVIVNGSQYRYEDGKLAGLLMEDQKTCIDLDQHTGEENTKLIRKFSEPKEHLKMCENAYGKFKEIVDYKKEQKSIEEFLSKLR